MGFLNRDGTINIDTRSYSKTALGDLYHALLSTSWIRMLFFVGFVYLAVNLLFGLGYFLAGPGALEGLSQEGGMSRFLDCFFFSVQTLATIGYGKISPASILAQCLVTVEALSGLLGLAVVTGIIFSRFSRPTARVIFSDKALVTSMGGQPSLIFRLANARMNQIVEAQIRVVLARTETTVEGQVFRELYDLKLERDRTPLFSMSWTIVHPIDSESPLYGMTARDLQAADAGIIVTMNGTDETFLQTVLARNFYPPESVVWNARFADMLTYAESGKVHVDISAISEILPA